MLSLPSLVIPDHNDTKPQFIERKKCALNIHNE